MAYSDYILHIRVRDDPGDNTVDFGTSPHVKNEIGKHEGPIQRRSDGVL